MAHSGGSRARSAESDQQTDSVPVAHGIDAIDRKSLEQEDFERCTELEGIYKTAPAGLCFVDASLRYVRISEHLAQMNGAPVEAHIGRTLREMVPGMAEAVELVCRDVMASGLPVMGYEIHGTTPAAPDSGRDWLASFYPLKAADGSVAGVTAVIQDITERKQVQIQIAESNARLTSVLESITDGFVTLDRDWRYTYVNAEAARQGRSKREEMLGKTLWDIFPQAQGTIFERELQRSIAEQVPVAFEVENLPQNQAFRLRAYPGADGLSIYGVDISGEKEAAVARARLAAIVESSDDAIISKDLNGIVTSWNKGAEQIFGYEAHEMIGQPISKLTPPERIDEMPTILNRIKRGDRVDHYETVRRAKSGRLLNISLTVSPIHDNTGRIIGASKVARNITEQKAASEAIKQSEIRLNLALEAGDMGAWEWDIGQARVEWSPQLEAIHGLEPGTFGGTFEDFQRDIHPEDRDRVIGAIHEAVEKRADYRVEYRIVLPDGKVAWIEARGRLTLNGKGAPERMVGVCMDITDRKRAETEFLKQVNRVARSNADLREFAYVASHDLQEPLRNISAFTQMLAQRYRGKFDADADQYIKYVTDAAARMTQLIRDLLGYTRLINTEEVPFTDVSLGEAVGVALRDLHVSVQGNHAVVDVAPLPSVPGDEVQLAQLFQNLIGNAIKYRRSEPPHILISAETKGSEVIVSVRDNGIGIDGAYHQKIFGVFKRLHGAEHPGTGIGLAICKNIVEKHGGVIWVESTPGQGSTFKFSMKTGATLA
jgi:PAS domain S-box-containing protein